MKDLDYGPDLNPILFKPAAGERDPNMMRAYRLYLAGRLEEAAGIYRQVLAGNPRHAEARHLLGLTVLRSGNVPLAIQEMKAALNDPEQPPAIYYASRGVMTKVGLQGREPAPAIYHANLGLALNIAGQRDQAIAALRRACVLDPANIDFNTKLAAVLFHAGRLEEALETVQRSLQQQPPDIQALETQRRIKLQQFAPAESDQVAPDRASSAATVMESATEDFTVTISARGKQGHVSQMLQDLFGSVPLQRIDSIFGFHNRCRLYGGRYFTAPELTDADLQWMYAHAIGFRIPLTNNLATEADYETARPFLEQHHRPGNSVIVVKDSIARWIRRDFPLYTIEASVIRGTDTAEKLLRALEIFDTIVPLPEAFNTDYRLLESFPQEVKKRMRLFLNAGCAYHCPRRICYGSFSRINLEEPGATFECSQVRLSHHFTQGMVDFPMQRFLDLGYRKFKLLGVRRGTGATGQ